MWKVCRQSGAPPQLKPLRNINRKRNITQTSSLFGVICLDWKPIINHSVYKIDDGDLAGLISGVPAVHWLRWLFNIGLHF